LITVYFVITLHYLLVFLQEQII